jgi:hypothetical protein
LSLQKKYKGIWLGSLLFDINITLPSLFKPYGSSVYHQSVVLVENRIVSACAMLGINMAKIVIQKVGRIFDQSTLSMSRSHWSPSCPSPARCDTADDRDLRAG